MLRKISFVCVLAMFFAGCASVPMESDEISDKAKLFNPPSKGNAGLYIYRGGGPGAALTKDIWVDGKCIGETAPNVFFYEEVVGGKEHTIATESEFSPNEIKLTTESGRNYFVEQYIKMGVFVGGADIEVVDEVTGKQEVQKLGMAIKGTCSPDSQTSSSK